MPVFRFAPSPNGEMHLGHAYSAILNHDMARTLGGRFLLRIEDIDTGRTRERFIAQIFEDLAWLGLTWEEPVRRQSEHFADYRGAIARLAGMGVLYPCFCTRTAVEAAVAALGGADVRDPDGAPLYPGICRGLPEAEIAARASSGEPFALRLDVTSALTTLTASDGPLTVSAFEPDGSETDIAVNPGRWGDAVIVRKDTPTSYHLSVVVDDELQDVTHVVRGADLLAATDLHRLLQHLLGLPVPRYHHHRLITDVTGRKLAKSLRDTSLRSLREGGITPADIRRMIGLPVS